MILVKSNRDPRSYVQNGFWVFKWLIVIGLVAGFFHIPDGQGLIFSKGRLQEPELARTDSYIAILIL